MRLYILGMDNEMHVYSQWHGPSSYNDVSGVCQAYSSPSSHNLRTVGTVGAELSTPAGGKMSTLRISQSVSELTITLDIKQPILYSKSISSTY